MIPEIENENEEWFLSQLYLKFGKTYFEVSVLLLFFTFRLYIFILRYYILVFYCHIDFVSHNSKIVDQGFFFQLLTFVPCLTSHNYISIVLLQYFFIFLSFFFLKIFKYKP